MKRKIQLLPSGIPLVDTEWGGFYRGGTYLLIGAHKTGRTLLSLQYAMESASQKEVCLYFTCMRPKDLMIQAASIDFDLQHYMDENQIIVVRVAPPSSEDLVGNSDDFLIEYINDIATVVEQYKPSKIVFDELTPFVEFNNISLLESTLTNTFDKIEDAGITSLFVLSDPATDATQGIVDTVASFSTGVVYIKKEDEDDRNGQMTITPNVGHTEGQFRCAYKLEPYKGVIIEVVEENRVSIKNTKNSNVA